MRKVQCHDCGKRYDYDVDDFCPRCGAFTQPARTARIDMTGAVVRAEGINERNHRNSFVHAEFHGENKMRKGSALEGMSLSKKPRVKKENQMKQKNTSDIALDILGEALDLVADFIDT